ncbi:hypothetical protein Pcinc_015053 [Petrolisthes cinctipes]|uniref:Uncharacterized protein n=1 Tax=Petrolisthes cinctipes TaxID=88211 RepID=A0AAE1FVB6_PETCI|nr:hypothetical protein Pcinc_015053 [Petrolisthes cinctipes]
MDLEDKGYWQTKRKKKRRRTGRRRTDNPPTNPPPNTSASSLSESTHEPPSQNNAINTSPVPTQLSPAISIDSLASVDVEELGTGDNTALEQAIHKYVTVFFHDNLIKNSKPD